MPKSLSFRERRWTREASFGNSSVRRQQHRLDEPSGRLRRPLARVYRIVKTAGGGAESSRSSFSNSRPVTPPAFESQFGAAAESASMRASFSSRANADERL